MNTRSGQNNNLLYDEWGDPIKPNKTQKDKPKINHAGTKEKEVEKNMNGAIGAEGAERKKWVGRYCRIQVIDLLVQIFIILIFSFLPMGYFYDIPMGNCWTVVIAFMTQKSGTATEIAYASAQYYFWLLGMTYAFIVLGNILSLMTTLVNKRTHLRHIDCIHHRQRTFVTTRVLGMLGMMTLTIISTHIYAYYHLTVNLYLICQILLITSNIIFLIVELKTMKNIACVDTKKRKLAFTSKSYSIYTCLAIVILLIYCFYGQDDYAIKYRIATNMLCKDTIIDESMRFWEWGCFYGDSTSSYESRGYKHEDKTITHYSKDYTFLQYLESEIDKKDEMLGQALMDATNKDTVQNILKKAESLEETRQKLNQIKGSLKYKVLTVTEREQRVGEVSSGAKKSLSIIDDLMQREKEITEFGNEVFFNNGGTSQYIRYIREFYLDNDATVEDKSHGEIKLSQYEFNKEDTHFDYLDLIAEISYADGSISKAFVELDNWEEAQNAARGTFTIKWHDKWGEYSAQITLV